MDRDGCFFFPRDFADGGGEAIDAMPGQCRLGYEEVEPYLKPLVEKGLKTVLLFGVITRLKRVGHASTFYTFYKMFYKLNRRFSYHYLLYTRVSKKNVQNLNTFYNKMKLFFFISAKFKGTCAHFDMCIFHSKLIDLDP